MKKTLFYILFLCFVSTYSQRQAANWYFGENAGIRFDINNNIIPLNDGRLNTREGCSSISNNNGDLLFYTDGSTVYTNVHTVMRNGSGLLGDDSSTQSAIVVPRPNHPDIYYIFTVGSNNTGNGMKYSVVDMSRDMGRGEVTLKNQNLLSQSAEKIAAVLKDCETGAIWVIGLSDFNGTSISTLDTFHAFEVTDAGINTTAVKSNFDRIGITDARGYLKLSPDGTKLACTNTTNGLYLFDFDVTTGFASNRQRLTVPTSNNKPYGAEFSPDSQMLYVTASNDLFGDGDNNPSNHFSVLVQYNLAAADISGSAFIVDQRNAYRSALQLGPDGRIYRSMAQTYDIGSPFLSTINNPNALGAACNYDNNSVTLSANSMQGLPPFIASFFTEKIDIIRNGQDTTFLPLCTGDTYTLTADDIPGATYEWTFDGTVLPETDYDLDVTQAGTYELTIDLNNGDCEYLEGEAIVTYFDIPVANPVGNFNICDDDNDGSWNFDLTQQDAGILDTQDSTIYSVHYFESQIDADNNENEITGLYTNTTNPATVYARIHNDGNEDCYDTISFDIEVFNTPLANPVATFELCDDDADGDNTNGQININLQDFDDDILNGQNPLEYNVSYHSSQGDADTGDNALPSIYYNQTPFQEEIFVRVENVDNDDCFDTTSFDAIINPIPPSFDASLIQCDEDGTVDGFTVFNLNEAFDALTGNATGVFIEFYESFPDAQSSNSPVNANAYFNTANPQIVFARVIDDTTLCHSIAELTLEVSTTQINDYQAPEVCDELDSEDGINTFDLEQFTAVIQADNGITFPVTYYETYNDALLEQNELASPYTNTNPYSQTIYSRVENNNACFGIGEVVLTINPLPQLEDDETLLYCLNTFPDTIPIDAGIVGDSPNNYTYSWSTGQTTYEIDINAVGVYTVTAMNIYGCTKSRSITIEPSNIATFESIEVIDASDNNTITVIVSGEGEYEYALYDKDGQLYATYQSSNYFENVNPGLYTVSVRDVKNNCGIVDDIVSVIGFPKFFTPNGDGDNDTWQVRGVSQQFQPNTKILIFDRYGKLLKQLNPVGDGWDGTFNGQQMPVSDYWFTVQLQDGRLYRSHFTLKR
ncbi:T9SS type B sorting domain-containing protein [Hanstruepera flava]|uniref:T9SS type B sorting domain-containing protein n=1 Tax=Hanstruepera flava TaxID=2930218 RepID=UPI002028C079|nr:T9SS type B sorting domain-containing protein [Hanstruepera flava]